MTPNYTIAVYLICDADNILKGVRLKIKMEIQNGNKKLPKIYCSRMCSGNQKWPSEKAICESANILTLVAMVIIITSIILLL